MLLDSKLDPYREVRRKTTSAAEVDSRRGRGCAVSRSGSAAVYGQGVATDRSAVRWQKGHA
jgi:hypothetical protein